MKWLPKSISGQLLALWLLAMLIAHVIAVITLSWWRVENMTIHPISARAIETRILAAYRAVSHSNDVEHLLDDISLPDSKFTVVSHPAANSPGMGKQEGEIAQGLRDRLNLDLKAPVNVHLFQEKPSQGRKDNRNWLEKAFRGTSAWALEVEVGLPDGTWLRSKHWPTILPAHWGRVLTFSIIVCMIPTTIIAIFFGRRIMRPLRELTKASKRVSRGEYVELSQPAGPEGVREITQAFNDMQESLGRFIKGRTQMIAAIGHDLRTPLTSLRIRAEMIDDDELRDGMVRTLDDMMIMVEGTLQFARDDALQEPTQDIQINALIKEVVDSQVAQGKSVRWTSQAEDELFYRCKPVHLKRAMTNLIDNAAKYGEVTVSVVPFLSDNVLRIQIEDNGPGIAAEHREHVFEPFVRLDTARNQDAGGAGLGLSIARSCVRAHGGEISLSNRAAGGLLATIDLPI